MRRDFFAWVLVGCAVLALGSGCTALQTRSTTSSSSGTWSGPTPSPAAPSDWTMVATGAYMGDQGRVFYAIGNAGGMRNTTLLRATADNQAQQEMSRIVTHYVRALAEAAGPGGEGAPLHLLIKSALQKARIVDHRQGQADAMLALCSLELSTFKQILSAEGELAPDLRKRMLAEADRVHAEMAGSPRGF